MLSYSRSALIFSMHLNMENLSMIASSRCSRQPIETNSFHYSIYFKGSAPSKRQETSDFLMFFRKYRKNPVPWNGLNIFLTNMSVEYWYSWLFRNRACFSTDDLHWFFQRTQRGIKSNMEHLLVTASSRCSWQPIETINTFHYSIYFKGNQLKQTFFITTYMLN